MMPRQKPPAAAEAPARNAAAARQWLESMVVKSPAAGSTEIWNGGLFDSIPLSGLRLSFVGSGRAICFLRVTPTVADEEGNWHLGAIATVIDDVGAAAIMSVVGEIKISVDFSISLFSKAKIDEEMEIEAAMVENKGKLTAVVVEVRNKETGKLVAVGRQWMSLTRASNRPSNL